MAYYLTEREKLAKKLHLDLFPEVLHENIIQGYFEKQRLRAATEYMKKIGFSNNEDEQIWKPSISLTPIPENLSASSQEPEATQCQDMEVSMDPQEFSD